MNKMSLSAIMNSTTLYIAVIVGLLLIFLLVKPTGIFNEKAVQS